MSYKNYTRAPPSGEIAQSNEMLSFRVGKDEYSVNKWRKAAEIFRTWVQIESLIPFWNILAPIQSSWWTIQRHVLYPVIPEDTASQCNQVSFIQHTAIFKYVNMLTVSWDWTILLRMYYSDSLGIKQLVYIAACWLSMGEKKKRRGLIPL